MALFFVTPSTTMKPWDIVGNLSAVATLLGVGATSFLSDATKSHVALASFLIALAFLTWKVVRALQEWQGKTYPKGYVPIATFIRLRTNDGSHYIYEAYRHIQVKQAFMSKFEHRFSWTGSQEPQVRSDLQEIEHVANASRGEMASATLKLRGNRTYNESEVIHIAMHLDDSDQASKPFLCATVDNPVHFLHFRAEFGHYNKPSQYGSNARLEKRSLSATEHAEFTCVKIVPFDQTSKSYECLVPQPEAGYRYRLIWDRPSPPQRKRGKQ